MNVPEKFIILYEDEELVAINKPAGILVHPTRISEDTLTILPLLRDQLGGKMYPVHRLDRGTSGVLVFGKNSMSASSLNRQFRERAVKKKYRAVIRGFVEPMGKIDHPLAGDGQKKARQAITEYRKISQSEMDFAISRYPTSRYSLVEVSPLTGRHHQIRRHFAHIRHPVIGDKRHGDCKHNKYFREQLGIERMLLHACQLSLLTRNDQHLTITAPLERSFRRAMGLLKLAQVGPEADGGSTSDQEGF